jgi:hypothetical protein
MHSATYPLGPLCKSPVLLNKRSAPLDGERSKLVPYKTYAHAFNLTLLADEHGIIAEYEVRWNSERGTVVSYCVALRLRDDLDRGRLKDIVRYDGDHGHLHRHAPGFPPGEPTPVLVPPGSYPIQVALDDLLKKGDEYMREARLTGFEVPEDVDETVN